MIEIALFKDRTKPGSIWCRDAGGVTAGPFYCLGKSDNLAATKRGNPTRNPLFSYGDTPIGKYKGYVNKLPATPTNEKTYGTQAVIALDPIEGDAAAAAAKRNGRFGLLIHGGALSAAGKLRPTFGCVRVADADMKVILEHSEKVEDVTITEIL